MKKLLAIAMIAGSLITSVFAQERETLNNVNLVIPVRNASGSVKGIGVDWHGYTFKNSSFGILTGCSFWIPLDLLSNNSSGAYAFDLDGTFGASFKVLDTDMFSAILSAGVNINMFDVMDVLYEFDFGVCADACVNFKLFDDFYITGGVQFNYYFYSYALIPGYAGAGANEGITTIAPRIGVTFVE